MSITWRASTRARRRVVMVIDGRRFELRADKETAQALGRLALTQRRRLAAAGGPSHE